MELTETMVLCRKLIRTASPAPGEGYKQQATPVIT